MNRNAFYSAQDFLSDVIEPALCSISEIPYSKAAAQLVLGTALHESMGLKYRQQINGPALGLFQMEPATYQDIWANFLAYRPKLSSQLQLLRQSAGQGAFELRNNDLYAAAMARVHYYRIGEFSSRSPIPDFDNITAQSNYWKRHYNTHLGKGTPTKYRNDWIAHGGAILNYIEGCQ